MSSGQASPFCDSVSCGRATLPWLSSMFMLIVLLALAGAAQAVVRIAVLAPGDDSLPYSLNQVLPPVLWAARRWPGFSVVYRDTQCSSTVGPLAAMDLKSSVDVFLGPICPYVLAPVARYAAVWDLPLLTPGGQNDNFDTKDPQYRLLTRMNGSYSQIGLIFVRVLSNFNWKIVALVLHNFEDQSLGHSNCYFTMGAVYRSLGRSQVHKVFDETNEVDYIELVKEIASQARGHSRNINLAQLFKLDGNAS
ncbi:NPR2 [Cordylochernes scorpioides]|uniref:NPR2 n=1 Tax=Cordylochernes scorpioides TaxID=51811 RepID=A0ABY6LT75_9ARAC|nr:NPR2 [Cordylochernes scorpioides]